MRQTRRVMAAAMFVGIMMAGSTAVASAAPINARERLQRDRIAAGFRSGELNKRETAGLAFEQGRIRCEEYRFRHNDGVLGPLERTKLQQDLNRSDRHIYNQKHD